MFRKLISVFVGLTMMGMVGSASAAIVINAVETGGDVVFSTEAGGSLDLSGLVSFANPGIGGFVYPDSSIFFMGEPSDLTNNFYEFAMTGPANFGSGTGTHASSGTGVHFGINMGATDGLFMQPGYVSGDLLSSTSTYIGATFASLGITNGNYVWSVSNGDTITLHVVPLPAALPLFFAALAAFGFAGWRQRRGAGKVSLQA